MTHSCRKSTALLLGLLIAPIILGLLVESFLLPRSSKPSARHQASRNNNPVNGGSQHRTTAAAASFTFQLAASTIEDRSAARALVFQGMEAFRKGDVAGSIQYFDQAERVQGDTLTPFLWQRGLSYYYANDFAKASQQFRTDVRVNPSDVEEIVWDIAAQLRMDPHQFPVPTQMALPPGTRDRRRIMVRGLSPSENALSMFRIECGRSL